MSEPSPEFSSPSLPLRLLIVEDDPVMQLGLEQFFEDYCEYEVVGRASDGYRAVEVAIALQPDIIIMDIGLPQMDGIEATQQIKQANPHIRVVMLTSHTAETEMIAALSSGADAYCVKGASADQILLAIASATTGATYLDPRIARQVIDHLKPTSVNPSVSQLTERELEVLKLIVDGKTNPEIAGILYLSSSTVKAHVRSIMNKLAVDDRVQAAVVALRSGLF
ncbi:MAG TPA: response regulator transcription factor [Crinalium sp.]